MSTLLHFYLKIALKKKRNSRPYHDLTMHIAYEAAVVWMTDVNVPKVRSFQTQWKCWIDRDLNVDGLCLCLPSAIELNECDFGTTAQKSLTD